MVIFDPKMGTFGLKSVIFELGRGRFGPKMRRFGPKMDPK